MIDSGAVVGRSTIRIPPGTDSLLFTGTGRRADPIKLPVCSSDESIFARLRYWRAMESGIGASWKIKCWEELPADQGSGERVVVVRRTFTETQVLTDDIGFHFDVSSVDAPRVPTQSPTVWTDGESISFPHDLAWLHFDGHEDNSDAGPLDVSLFYSGEFGKAGVYVYGECAENDEGGLQLEAARVVETAMAANPGAELPWPLANVGQMLGQFLLLPGRISFAGVTERGGRFIKLRLTTDYTEEVHQEMLNDCLHAVIRAIDHQNASWVPITDAA
jgi:hypothetical protein